MRRLEKGMLIKTNYSGPYRIVSIIRGCTCPLYSDTLKTNSPPDQPPHIHLTVSDPHNSRRLFWLNHWNEETLLSLGKSYCGMKTEPDYDQIFILENDKPIQLSMFD